jgi:hypothetical protein
MMHMHQPWSFTCLPPTIMQEHSSPTCPQFSHASCKYQWGLHTLLARKHRHIHGLPANKGIGCHHKDDPVQYMWKCA